MLFFREFMRQQLNKNSKRESIFGIKFHCSSPFRRLSRPNLSRMAFVYSLNFIESFRLFRQPRPNVLSLRALFPFLFLYFPYISTLIIFSPEIFGYSFLFYHWIITELLLNRWNFAIEREINHNTINHN